MCEECNITFIGPKSATIDAMGNKINARQLMQEANVPVIPGSTGVLSTVEEALEIADRIGYPVMLKAAAGGGGKAFGKFNQKKSSHSIFLQLSKKQQRHLEMMICIWKNHLSCSPYRSSDLR